MTKIKKPTGLIRYTTENELKGIAKPRFQIRNAVYLIIMTFVVLGLVFSLNKRAELKTQFLRTSKTPYQEILLKSGTKEIVNHYRLKVFQAGEQKIPLLVQVDQSLEKDLTKIKITMPYEYIDTKNDHFQTPIFFNFPQEILKDGKRKIKIKFINKTNNQIIQTNEVKLVGPFR